MSKYLYHTARYSKAIKSEVDKLGDFLWGGSFINKLPCIIFLFPPRRPLFLVVPRLPPFVPNDTFVLSPPPNKGDIFFSAKKKLVCILAICKLFFP